MQTSNTEEMVTISRAEYERLQQENAQLEAKSATLEETHARLEAKLAAREQEQAQVITSLTLQNEWLLEQLKLGYDKAGINIPYPQQDMHLYLHGKDGGVVEADALVRDKP